MQSRRSHAPKRQAPKRTTKSRRVPREGWDESFRLIAIRGDDALLDDVTGLTSFDETEWEW